MGAAFAAAEIARPLTCIYLRWVVLDKVRYPIAMPATPVEVQNAVRPSA